MMGAFSMYTGLIYNDIFSKSFNIFGSHWAWRENFTFPLEMGKSIELDPGNFSIYKGDPYYFGIDPGWQAASNKIIFLNGYKMKISLIFGLIHMLFGITLRYGFAHVSHKLRRNNFWGKTFLAKISMAFNIVPNLEMNYESLILKSFFLNTFDKLTASL